MLKLPSSSLSEWSHLARPARSTRERASSEPRMARALTAAYVGAKWDSCKADWGWHRSSS